MSVVAAVPYCMRVSAGLRGPAGPRSIRRYCRCGGGSAPRVTVAARYGPARSRSGCRSMKCPRRKAILVAGWSIPTSARWRSAAVQWPGVGTCSGDERLSYPRVGREPP